MCPAEKETWLLCCATKSEDVLGDRVNVQDAGFDFSANKRNAHFMIPCRLPVSNEAFYSVCGAHTKQDKLPVAANLKSITPSRKRK
jgi:hypothetical protein